MAGLVDFGEVMSDRIRSCLVASGFRHNDWNVHKGIPDRLSGRNVWPQIENVNYNLTLRSRVEFEGLVYFAIPSQGKAGEVSRMMYRLMDASGFARHWQAPPYPDGFDHIVSRRFTVEPPESVGDVTFGISSFRFTGIA